MGKKILIWVLGVFFSAAIIAVGIQMAVPASSGPKDYAEAGKQDLDKVWNFFTYTDFLCRYDLTTWDKSILASKLIVIATYRGERTGPLSIDPERTHDSFVVDEVLKGEYTEEELIILNQATVKNEQAEIAYIGDNQYLLMLRPWVKDGDVAYYPIGPSGVFNVTNPERVTAISKMGKRLLKESTRDRQALVDTIKNSEVLDYGYIDVGRPTNAKLKNYKALVNKCEWVVEGTVFRVDRIRRVTGTVADGCVVYFTVDTYTKGEGLPETMVACCVDTDPKYAVGDKVYAYIDDGLAPEYPYSGIATKALPQIK